MQNRLPPRVARGKDDKKNADKYLGRAKRALILEAAAEAWAAGGIEWDDALGIAKRAINKAAQILVPEAKAAAQAKASFYAKAKAKPKAKAVGRAKAQA